MNVPGVSAFAAPARIAIVLILLPPRSKRAVGPFVANARRQRRFLTDASHGFKTPLTSIAANAGILEMSPGKNGRPESTKTQAGRLNHPIRDLAGMTAAEEDLPEGEAVRLSVSGVVQDAASSLKPPVAVRDRTLGTGIGPGIRLRGLQESVYRPAAILPDNAVKYGGGKETIRPALALRGEKRRSDRLEPLPGARPRAYSKMF